MIRIIKFKRIKHYCKCGCGELVKYSALYNKWNTFCLGHRLSKYDKTNPPLCSCGCGNFVKWSVSDFKWNKYIRKHRQLKGGWKHTENTKTKMSISGKKVHGTEEAKERKRNEWTKQMRENASQRMKNRCADPIYFLKMQSRMLERWKNPDYVAKQKAYTHTIEWKENSSKIVKARWTEKFKQSYIEKYSMGANNPNWKGGLSFLPYSHKFTKALKRKIKERDHHQCQNPNCPKTHILMSVHHIDYDKQNCEPYNLITLCMPCNQRANGNRGYWKILYTAINDKRNRNSKFSIS